MIKQDWQKEMNEFVAAAHIFKPLAGSMATRFTSSSPLMDRSTSAMQTDHNITLQIIPKTEDSTEEAAKLLIYGALTRAVIDFTPSRLLSKRFNVRPLHSHDESHMTAPTMLPLLQSNTSLDSLRITSNDQPRSISLSVFNPEKNEALEHERAADEVFETIFGDN